MCPAAEFYAVDSQIHIIIFGSSDMLIGTCLSEFRQSFLLPFSGYPRHSSWTTMKIEAISSSEKSITTYR